MTIEETMRMRESISRNTLRYCLSSTAVSIWLYIFFLMFKHMFPQTGVVREISRFQSFGEDVVVREIISEGNVCFLTTIKLKDRDGQVVDIKCPGGSK